MDEEFPIRHPGAGVASPVAPEYREYQAEPIRTIEENEEHFAMPQATSLQSHHEPTAASGSDSPPNSSAHGTAVDSPAGYRANPPNTLRYSIVSADTSQSRGSRDRPQRKKSTLRGALGKLFGRKKKSNSNNNTTYNNSVGILDSEGGSALGGSNLRQSVSRKGSRLSELKFTEGQNPIARVRPFNGLETKRSASLPITEYDRALRSHSIGPDDVLAIESARNSLSADFGFSRRRTGTASTHVVGVLRSRDGSFSGLSPRPASMHGRDNLAGHSDDPNEIGRAITSDAIGLRRRSRSLSGLVEAHEESTEVRRRSDEIRYWRQSYDPAFMSPISSNGPEGETEEPIAVEAPQAETVQEKPPRTPLEPFKFGSLASMNEMAGMKITQAANIETRIGSLEARVRRLERVVTQLCDNAADFRPHAEAAHRAAPPMPKQDPSIAYTSSTVPLSPSYQPSTRETGASTRATSSRHSEVSRTSFGEAPTYVGSIYRSALQPPLISDRPVSTATIRGTTSLPTLTKDPLGAFTADQYATVMALIDTERSARLALEAQVKSLGYQISIITKSAGSRRDTRYDPPPTAKSFGERSAFDHDDEEEERRSTITRTKPRGRTHYPEDSGIATELGDFDDESDTYETPREEMQSYGAFDEDLDEDDTFQHKDPRTLSLSQLTLGRKPRNHQPLPQVI